MLSQLRNQEQDVSYSYHHRVLQCYSHQSLGTLDGSGIYDAMLIRRANPKRDIRRPSTRFKRFTLIIRPSLMDSSSSHASGWETCSEGRSRTPRICTSSPVSYVEQCYHQVCNKIELSTGPFTADHYVLKTISTVGAL